jgi:hypothetical protein
VVPFLWFVVFGRDSSVIPPWQKLELLQEVEQAIEADLLVVSRGEVAAVGADEGLVSGHPFGHALKVVRINCVVGGADR